MLGSNSALRLAAKAARFIENESFTMFQMSAAAGRERPV
jgi:hypothetical protein